MTGLNNPDMIGRISMLGFRDPQQLNGVYNINELVVDWLRDTVTVHNGETAGGAFSLANATLSNVNASIIMNKLNNLSPDKIALTGVGVSWFSENGSDSNKGTTPVSAVKSFTTAFNKGANIIGTLDAGTMTIPNELTTANDKSHIIFYAPLKTITWTADWVLPENVLIICDGFYSNTNVCSLNGRVRAINADQRTEADFGCVACLQYHEVETLLPVKAKYYSQAAQVDYSKVYTPNWSDIVDRAQPNGQNFEMAKNGTVYWYFNMGTDDNHRPTVTINDKVTVQATRFITVNEPDFGWSVNTFQLAKGDKTRWNGSAGGVRMLVVYNK